MKTNRKFTPVILIHVLILAWLPMAAFGHHRAHHRFHRAD